MNRNELTGKTFTGAYDVACSFKSDSDAPESSRKKVILDVRFKDIPLADIVYAAAKKVVVPFQNGRGRKHFDTFTSGQRVEIEFTRPASAPVIDPEVATIAKIKSMGSIEEKEAYIADLLAKAEESN